jgi:hypothetical protein
MRGLKAPALPAARRGLLDGALEVGAVVGVEGEGLWEAAPPGAKVGVEMACWDCRSDCWALPAELMLSSDERGRGERRE